MMWLGGVGGKVILLGPAGDSPNSRYMRDCTDSLSVLCSLIRLSGCELTGGEGVGGILWGSAEMSM
jgi:hypothetical protein